MPSDVWRVGMSLSGICTEYTTLMLAELDTQQTPGSVISQYKVAVTVVRTDYFRYTLVQLSFHANWVPRMDPAGRLSCAGITLNGNIVG